MIYHDMIYKERVENMIKLTKRQEDVMNVLWESQKPMIASEIMKKREDFNINTVQSTLRTLVKKKYIEVADIVYSGTVLSRSYRPVLKREEVTTDVELGMKAVLKKANLFARYVDEIDDLDTIVKLEKVLEEKKKELEANR